MRLQLSISFAAVLLLPCIGPAQALTPLTTEQGITISRYLISKEVEKREGVRVTGVDVTEPGVATARFVDGTATVRFGFIDPIRNCPIDSTRNCEKEAFDNPIGFKVTSYKSPTQESGADPYANSPQAKRAHNVVFDEVKALPNQKASAIAVLTYEDGTKARCRYTMRYQKISVGDGQGIQFIPESEKCVALK